MLKKLLKWIGIVVGGLVGLLVVALIALYIVGGAKVDKEYKIAVKTVTIPTDAEAIERGKHISTIFFCTRCHTDKLSGDVYFEVPGMVSIPTPNLTAGAGGVGGLLTDEDWVRAIRHGVNDEGKAIFIMPSNKFYYMSDEDLGDLIAFLKSQPAVDNVLPGKRVEALGRVMMAVGMFPPLAVDQIDHASQPPAAPAVGVTAAYGKYLSHTCTECHGDNLNGQPFGPPGQEVPSPNLTPGGELASWSEQGFFTTMRTGMTPEGRILIEEMPWKYFGQMSDDELRAVWLYLQSLPALEQGGL